MNNNNLPVQRTENNNYNYNNLNNGYNDSEDDFQILEHLKVINKYRNLILATTLFSIIVGLVYSFTATPQYSAYSTVQIENYQPILMGGNLEELMSKNTNDQKYIETKIEELTSLSVADMVLNDQKIFNLIKEDSERKSLLSFLNFGDSTKKESASRYKHSIKYLKSYIDKVKVEPLRKTSLIELHIIDSNPENAAYMANAHAESYINWVRDNRVEKQARGLKFLNSEKAKIKKKINDVEREMADYAEENSIVAVNENENVVMSKVSKLNEMLIDATRNRIEAEKTYEQASKSKNTSSSSFDDRSTQELRTQLATLESKRSQLLNKYTNKYPKVKELTAEINGLRNTVSNNEANLIRGLKIKADTALQEEQNLKEELEQQESKAFELSKKQVKYNSLKRDADTQRELLKNISNQIEETSLAVESNSSNLSIVDYATTPPSPKYPRKKFVIILATLIGLVAGFSLALLINIFDNKIHTPEELENILQIPNLGVVPKFEIEANRRVANKLLPDVNIESEQNLNAKESKQKTKPEIDEKLNDIIKKDITKNSNGGSIIPNNGNSNLEIEIEFVKQPSSLASEAYRTIRTGILLSQAGEPPKTIMFTSAQSSEGKTTLASNIAASLASSGAQVAVVDCDLRRPSITKVFNATTSDLGLAEILTGQCEINDAIQIDTIKNIHLIPCGKIPPNPAELLGSKFMADLIDQLEARFDYVILDTPPVLPVTDSVILSKLVDGVMFVVKGDLTPKKVAQDAKNRLTNVGAKIIGTVLNNIDIKKRTYSYYNKYHYSYYEQQDRA